MENSTKRKNAVLAFWDKMQELDAVVSTHIVYCQIADINLTLEALFQELNKNGG